MAGRSRTLLTALAAQVQTLDGGGDSGVDLSDAEKTHFGRWSKMPGHPPQVFIYSPADRSAQNSGESILGTRDRAPRVHVDIWHANGADDGELHLNSLDLKDEIIPVLEQTAWIKALRAGTPGLTRLELAAIEAAIAPGHLYGQKKRGLLRLLLRFTWRTDC